MLINLNGDLAELHIELQLGRQRGELLQFEVIRRTLTTLNRYIRGIHGRI